LDVPADKDLALYLLPWYTCGRAAVWAEFGFVRVQHGKITDWWITEDTFSQFTQLGYTIEGPAVGEA
jgi:hypothetical protein